MNKNGIQVKKQTKDLATNFPIGVVQRVRSEINSVAKIRNTPSNEAIIQSLRYCFVLVGLRQEQFPDEAQTAVLIDFIKRRLGNYTPNEIKMAFEMAIAGDFKVGSGKDELNPFGNFSPLYFQTIFNAYVAHRNKIAIALKREEDVLKIQESIEESERRKKVFFNQSVEMFNNSKTTFLGDKFNANALYFALKPSFTTEELVDFKNQEKERMSQQKTELEAQKKGLGAVSKELLGLSFSVYEWRCRVSVIVVNEAIKRGVKL